jgi:hypothetical protein
VAASTHLVAASIHLATASIHLMAARASANGIRGQAGIWSMRLPVASQIVRLAARGRAKYHAEALMVRQPAHAFMTRCGQCCRSDGAAAAIVAARQLRPCARLHWQQAVESLDGLVDLWSLPKKQSCHDGGGLLAGIAARRSHACVVASSARHWVQRHAGRPGAWVGVAMS